MCSLLAGCCWGNCRESPTRSEPQAPPLRDRVAGGHSNFGKRVARPTTGALGGTGSACLLPSRPLRRAPCPPATFGDQVHSAYVHPAYSTGFKFILPPSSGGQDWEGTGPPSSCLASSSHLLLACNLHSAPLLATDSDKSQRHETPRQPLTHVCVYHCIEYP